MSTTAVTPGASAVSDREPSSRFLPTDEKYRLTGKLPDSEPETAATQRIDTDEQEREDGFEVNRKARAEKEASAASESDTAAASEAAEPTEAKGPAASKSERTSESRWAKITRENRELRERVARFEGRDEGREAAKPRETEQKPQPATAKSEPQLSDLDEQGKAKYLTVGDYLKDHAKWVREDTLREAQELFSKQQRDQQLAQSEQAIERTVNERVTAARKAHADYDEAIADALSAKDDLGREAFFWTKGSHLDGFFLDSERGHDVLYQIAKNFGDYAHIFARDEQGNYLMNPVRQVRELARIENSLDAKPAASVTTVSKAARPVTQVSGKGTVARDAVEDAVEKGDTEAYMREQNARALARLKRK